MKKYLLFFSFFKISFLSRVIEEKLRSFLKLDCPNFCDTLWALYFRYQQTPVCNKEKIDAKYFSTERIFWFRSQGWNIGDFRENPEKFEFGAKITKSDFYSLDGCKYPKDGREVHSRPKTHHRTSFGVIDRRIRKIPHWTMYFQYVYVR